MKTLGIRVPDEDEKLLNAEAKQRGLSQSALGRDLIRQGLRNEHERLLVEEVRELKQLVLQLQRQLRRATVAILVDGGKADVEGAEAFVREDLS
jgi:hypothetical protein